MEPAPASPPIVAYSALGTHASYPRPGIYEYKEVASDQAEAGTPWRGRLFPVSQAW